MRSSIFFFVFNILLSMNLFSQNSIISIEILTDNYPSETSWILEDQNGNIIDQINFGELICANTYYNWDISVNDSLCYTFTIHDSYGDGICCTQGNGIYTLTYNSYLYTGGEFTNSETIVGICDPLVVGCTNPMASNYNPLADTNIVYGGILDPNIGSGSYYTGNRYLIFDSYVQSKIVSAVVYTQNQCLATFQLRDNTGNILEDTSLAVQPGGQRIYFDFNVPVGLDYQLGISGNNPGIYRNNGGVNYPYNIGDLLEITGSSAGGSYYYFYYDIEVEAVCTDVNSLIYGCTDSIACNYDINANIDNGSCDFPDGCTDSLAFNYNANATCDDGSCIPTFLGCIDSTACNYDINANVDNGSCDFPDGCTDSLAFNYNANATCDDGSCIPTYLGCMDSIACNYDTNANVDSGNCSYANDTILNVIACDSYTWIDGVNYTSSNYTAVYSLVNSAGCDSVLYLNLTIDQTIYDTIVVVANNSYFWNDTVYTASGFYNYVYNNFCDSVVVLDLTIIPVNDFSPFVSVSLSNTYCDSLTDLTIVVSQDSGEVDMSSSLFQSNLGSFDIASMNYGDTIGSAYLTAGGGTISLNTYIMVSLVVNSSQAVIVACDSLQGCLGSFTISNTAGGGVSIFANAIFDGNNYTSGNMSSITFEDVFLNPCGLLSFTTSINSELGDIDIQNFDYVLFSITYSDYNVDIVKQRELLKITDVLGREANVEPMKTLFYIYDDGTIEKKIILD